MAIIVNAIPAHSKFLTTVLSLYLILIHLVLIVLFLRTDIGNVIAYKLGFNSDTSSAIIHHNLVSTHKKLPILCLKIRPSF